MPRTLEAPPILYADVGPAVQLALFGAFAVFAIVQSGRMSFAERDVLPLAACAGAFVCALNEPIFDVLGKLTYAEVPDGYVAYTAFGRDVPWALMVGYIAWVGWIPVLLSRRMAAGAPRREFAVFAGGLAASVVALEFVNNAWLHMWRYYGEPWGVICGGSVQMAAMPLVCGMLLYLLTEGRGQAARLALGIAVPACALPMTFAATSWPLYLANYSDIPDALSWAAAGVGVAFSASAVVATTIMAEHIRAARAPLSRDAEGERLGTPARVEELVV